MQLVFRVIPLLLLAAFVFTTRDSTGTKNNSLETNNHHDNGISHVTNNRADSKAMVWSKSYGGNATDIANSIIQTSDGGYLMVGTSTSFGETAWIVKLDTQGNIQWQKIMTVGSFFQLPDRGYNIATGALQFPDNNYWIIGYSGIHDRFGCCASWIVDVDQNGSMVWAKFLNPVGGPMTSITHTRDGGAVLTGWNVGDEPPSSTGIIAKVDSNGNVTWTGTYYEIVGCSECRDGQLYSAQPTQDGGFLAVGSVESHPWILKTNEQGTILWQKIYSSTNFTNTGQFVSLQPGIGTSFVALANEVGHPLLVAIDSNGNIISNKIYGNGTAYHLSNASTGGGYVMTVNNGAIRIDATGDVLWHKTYTGLPPTTISCSPWSNCHDTLNYIAPTKDSGYILAGYTGAQGPYGENGDAWVLKIDSNGDCCPQNTHNVSTISFTIKLTSENTNATAIIRQENTEQSTPVTVSNIEAGATTLCPPTLIKTRGNGKLKG